MLQMIGNPLVECWGEDFYQREGRRLSLARARERLRHGSRRSSRACCSDDAESYSKQPLNDDVFGEAIGGGSAQCRRRRMALAAAADGAAVQGRGRARLCSRLRRGVRAGARALARGAARNGPSDQSRHDAGDLAGAARHRARRQPRRGGSAELSSRPAPRFSAIRCGRSRSPQLGLPPWIPHPGSRVMARAGRTMRDIAMRVLVNARKSAEQRDDLLGRLVDGKRPRHGRGHARRAHRR